MRKRHLETQLRYPAATGVSFGWFLLRTFRLQLLSVRSVRLNLGRTQRQLQSNVGLSRFVAVGSLWSAPIVFERLKKVQANTCCRDTGVQIEG